MLVKAIGPVVLAALLVSFSFSARAQDETQAPLDESACFDAYENTQVFRKKGELLKAREAARVCQSQQCPRELAETCMTWENELRDEVPAAIFAVRGPEGRDVKNASVSLDGEPLPKGLDGVPVELDPGPHTLTFSSPDGWQREMEVVISAGERNRRITVTKEVEGEEPTQAPQSEPRSRFTPVVIVSGSVGIAGFAAATVAAIGALNAKSELEACIGTCSAAEVDRARTWLTAADVGLIVGGVGLTTAVGFYIWGGPKDRAANKKKQGRNHGGRAQEALRSDQALRSSQPRGVRVGFTPLRGGAIGGVEGTF